MLFGSLWLLHDRMHRWLFDSIIPTAAVKMVDKSRIKETYSLMKFSGRAIRVVPPVTRTQARTPESGPRARRASRSRVTVRAAAGRGESGESWSAAHWRSAGSQPEAESLSFKFSGWARGRTRRVTVAHRSDSRGEFSLLVMAGPAGQL
jgi:hypothetical protein